MNTDNTKVNTNLLKENEALKERIKELEYEESKENINLKANRFIQHIIDTGWNLTSEQQGILFNCYTTTE